MIHYIGLKDFKCFHQRTEFPLSKINILYGKNGRGKSTMAQSLLLLSQTMRETDDVRELSLMGKFAKLGTFGDILCKAASEKEFSIDVEDDEGHIEMSFSEYAEKPQLARLTNLKYNGSQRFSELTTGSIAGDKQSDKPIKAVDSISDIALLQNLKSLSYISAARLGPRNYSPRNDMLESNDYGVNGEYVINVLLNQGEQFKKKVVNALSEILTGASLSVKANGADRIELFLDSVDGGSNFLPSNVGFGYSYILSVVVAALLAEEGSIIIVENPEAHLHPGAQSRLMGFLMRTAIERKNQLIIETHSDHIVNGLRIAMKLERYDLEPKDARILFFSHDNVNVAPEIRLIECDKRGELSEYPDDFLDEWSKQLVELI